MSVRIATLWLDGCSGCHMSLLDMDERLLEVVSRAELVYSPLVDAKEFPEGVDVAFVEGAASSDEDVELLRRVRARSRCLVALGDCAVTGNVAAMRNPFSVKAVMDRAYRETVDLDAQTPDQCLPKLNPSARPLHEVVPVDLYVPGCPPPADVIYDVITALLDGRPPDVQQKTRFGR